MSSNPETTRKLIYSILQFLTASLSDGSVREDDKEGVEIAVQCIGAAFDVDPTLPSSSALAVAKPLKDIFASYLSAPASSLPKPTPTPTSPAATPSTPSPAALAQAEKLKSSGNALMSKKDYAGAIAAYTSAIALHASNPVYYSNRAAAHSSLGDHPAAAEDAELALAADPAYAKAYSRLGHARYSMKQYAAAAEAFRQGLELDPGNTNMKTGLENAEARIPEEDPSSTPNPTAGAGAGAAADNEEILGTDPTATARSAGAGAGPGLGGFDMSRAAEMLGALGGGAGRGGGAGAGGAGGGMPDLAGLMNNPQVMQYAQQMMQNGGFEQLMNNPMLRNMASQFMGGQGRGAGGAPGGDGAL